MAFPRSVRYCFVSFFVSTCRISRRMGLEIHKNWGRGWAVQNGACARKFEKWHMRQVDGVVVSLDDSKVIINVRTVWQTRLEPVYSHWGSVQARRDEPSIHALAFARGCKPQDCIIDISPTPVPLTKVHLCTGGERWTCFEKVIRECLSFHL